MQHPINTANPFSSSQRPQLPLDRNVGDDGAEPFMPYEMLVIKRHTLITIHNDVLILIHFHSEITDRMTPNNNAPAC